MGDVIDHFITGLAIDPREWVLQQAPSTWYMSERDVYMKALQWETNNAHRVENFQAQPKVVVHTKEFKKNNKPGFKFDNQKFDNQKERKFPFAAGRAPAKRAKQERKRDLGKTPIPQALVNKRIEAKASLHSLGHDETM